MLCVDLYCGLGGWTDGFLAAGYDCIGFDIERHRYPMKDGFTGFTELDQYPGQLVIQDILTVHGSQFRDATCIVASPPCQKYSYMAMPWKRAKALIAWHRESQERITALNALFDACFRIQYEACEAAGRHIPLIVENVKGAQPWVGRAKASYGSFYLWGDVESVGGRIVRAGALEFGMPAIRAAGRCVPAKGRLHGWTNGTWQSDATKNTGGSWFAVAHNTESGHGQNPDGRKVAGLNWSGSDKPGYRAQGFNTTADARLRDSLGWSKDTPLRNNNSKSDSRKAASAQIAKIPFPLARHIAQIFAR